MDSIGRYTIEGEIAQGGFGVVYRGYDPTMHRKVAIKVLKGVDNPDTVNRFRAEARTTGNLHHRNIITVHDYGEHEGQLYLVMELLEGRSLEQLIAEGAALTLFEKANILAQMAEGLRYAHENGVIHRDVKPSNIIVLANGVVKILDFGIARVTEQGRTQTMTGFVVGTIEYMAPDQLDEGVSDAVTDIYSLGVTAYELLTRVQPFRTPQIISTMRKVTSHEPPRVRELAPECPEDLDRMVHTAIAKDRAQRYRNLDELLLDLAPVLASLRTAVTSELAAEAEKRFRASELESAQSAIRKLLELDPGHETAQRLRREIQRVRDQQAAAQVAQEAIQRAGDELAQQRYASAAQMLEGALRAGGANLPAELRTEMEALVVEANQAHEKGEKVRALLGQASDAAARDDLDAVARLAREAAAVDPHSPQAIEWVCWVDAELARRKGEAERRAAEETERKRVEEEAERRRLAEEAERKRTEEETERKRVEEKAERQRVAEETERRRIGDELRRRTAASQPRDETTRRTVPHKPASKPIEPAPSSDYVPAFIAAPGEASPLRNKLIGALLVVVALGAGWWIITLAGR